MRRFVAVGAGLFSIAALSGAVSAADLPAKIYTKAPPMAAAPMYNWAGFYVGLNGGGASSRNCWSVTNSSTGTPPSPISEGCNDTTAALFGGQVGYRWQLTSWVFGLEAQGDWTSLKGSNTGLGTFGGRPFSNQTKTGTIGLFTGQVGYAWNNLLGYVKGGAAVTHDNYSGVSQFQNVNLPPGFTFDQAAETRWGGAIGTGIEYGFAPGWSVAVEYDHLFMGSSSNNLINFMGGFDRTESVKQDVDMGTVRVNYTFGALNFPHY